MWAGSGAGERRDGSAARGRARLRRHQDVAAWPGPAALQGTYRGSRVAVIECAIATTTNSAADDADSWWRRATASLNIAGRYRASSGDHDGCAASHSSTVQYMQYIPAGGNWRSIPLEHQPDTIRRLARCRSIHASVISVKLGGNCIGTILSVMGGITPSSLALWSVSLRFAFS
jgi:hypothetical protein